jgi:hypothetical protein
MSLKNVGNVYKHILAMAILGQLWDLEPIYSATNTNKLLL